MQVNPQLEFLAPLKLQSSQLRQHQNERNAPNIDSLTETNEQSIEMEFLNLFDYARCKFVYKY